MKKSFLTLLLLISVTTPAAVLAQTSAPTPPPLDYSGFVKCDGVVKDNEPGRQKKCDFAMLMETVIAGINWLFYITIPIATALFAYAGVLFITGTQGNITKAKGIFTAVATGFIIMCIAWFAVRQFVEWFVADPAATTFLGK